MLSEIIAHYRQNKSSPNMRSLAIEASILLNMLPKQRQLLHARSLLQSNTTQIAAWTNSVTDRAFAKSALGSDSVHTSRESTESSAYMPFRVSVLVPGSDLRPRLILEALTAELQLSLCIGPK